VPLNVKILGKSYHIRFKNSEYTGWKVVCVASANELMGDIYQMILLYVCMLFLTLVLVTYLSRWLSGMITRPVVELRNRMKETEKGDLSVRFAGDGKDEISELGRTFNHMLERIQQLLNKVYEEEEEKRQAQLKIVQEQFKPHFLYNTLDTINWMARDYGADNVVKLVDALTNMFRISLSKGQDYIEIREEIKYISSYLYIQQIRYGEKVSYEISVADECLHVMVPKLILQPLVENAIYHGVKLKRCEGHLKVCVAAEENRISLSVADDGKGMSEEKRQELCKLFYSTQKPEEQSSFGLFYVKERLRLRYGVHYEVEVESKEDVGTRITIYIPKEQEDKYYE
ncbi:MAG: sensor histidine kinase, partial [Acetatifactor sp.]|nr:sensor histidine kinase [Acetatifactor sp.]